MERPNKFIYVPLEHIESRYTIHLDRDIMNYLNINNIQHVRIYPDIKPSRPLPPGMFLDAPFTTQFKSLQLAEIARMFETGEIADGDIIFFSDIWFPGIESIAYMKHFTNKHNVKIRGILHAGAFTDTDEVRNFERWAKNFEDVVFDICDRIYVASKFIADDIVKKRFINYDKISITPLPLDTKVMDQFKDSEKGIPTVIFNGRNHIEKQPHLFEELKRKIQRKWQYETLRREPLPQYRPEDCPWRFIWTQEQNLDKEAYYRLLSESHVVVSFAQQENFGYGIAEAVYLGCVPIVPNRLVYPELYDVDMLYGTFTQCVSAVYEVLTNYEAVINAYPDICNTNMLETGNLDSIKTWFTYE